MNVLILYHSLSGNTKATAEIIKSNVESCGYNTTLSPLDRNISIEEYDIVFIGTYTWGNGDTPNEVIEYLRWLLKQNNFQLPMFSVFGTGETQWTHFCRAVDELEYHLNKHTKVISKLKIEQHPINQIDKIKNFTISTMEVIR